MKRVREPEFEDEVLRYPGKVLVNFHADWDWCPDSRTQEPILDALATKLQGADDIKFVRVDVDESLNLSTLFRVDTLPTFILFDNGKPVLRAIGLQSEANLKKFLGIVPVEVPDELKGEAPAQQQMSGENQEIKG